MADESSTPPGWGALDWPEEWARERSFWREVAARTLAGAFALILLGGPSIIYLMLAGQLQPSAGFSILIGIVMVGLLAFIWWLTRRIVRGVAKRSLRRVVRAEQKAAKPGVAVNLESVNVIVNEYWRRRRERGDPFGEDFEATLVPRAELNSDIQKRMGDIVDRARLWSVVVGVAASAIALALSAWITVVLGN